MIIGGKIFVGEHDALGGAGGARSINNGGQVIHVIIWKTGSGRRGQEFLERDRPGLTGGWVAHHHQVLYGRAWSNLGKRRLGAGKDDLGPSLLQDVRNMLRAGLEIHGHGGARRPAADRNNLPAIPGNFP